MPEHLVRADRGANGDRQDDGGDRDDAGVGAQLFIVGEDAPVAPGQRAILQREVRAGQEHEDDDHPLRGGVPITRDRERVRREPGGGDGAEGVADRVEQRHAGHHQRDDLQERQRGIEAPQQRRRPANLRRDLLVVRPGRFGEEQLAAADRQPRQHRDEQRDHAHAAEPVGQRRARRNTLRPYSEKSRKTVAPVVVSPDIASNIESIGPRPFHM